MPSLPRSFTSSAIASETRSSFRILGPGLFVVPCALLALGAPIPLSGQVGLTGGGEYGFGAAIRVGSPIVKLEAGVGFAPVLVFGTEQVSINGAIVSDDIFFEAFFPTAVGAKLNLRVRGDEDDVRRTGLEFGAVYNDLIKLGLGGGIDSRVSERIVVSGGLSTIRRPASDSP